MMNSKNSLPLDPLNPDREQPASGWNWGGFFLPLIWGICHRCWIAWLVFIPILGPLVVPFILGFKGNDWAWNNKSWESAAEFNRVQKKWAKVGLILVIIKIAIVVAWNSGFLSKQLRFQLPHFKKLSISAPHLEKSVLAEVLLSLKKDTDLLKEMGEPLKTGKVLRLRRGNESNLKELFDIELEISGSIKKGSAFVEAEVDTGVVLLKQLVVYFQNPAKKVWIIPHDRQSASAAA